jgi:hypothetical protein
MTSPVLVAARLRALVVTPDTARDCRKALASAFHARTPLQLELSAKVAVL